MGLTQRKILYVYYGAFISLDMSNIIQSIIPRYVNLIQKPRLLTICLSSETFKQCPTFTECFNVRQNVLLY